MDSGEHELVRERAGERCEYCLLEQKHTSIRHQVQFVVAKQQGGSEHADNLALACHRCNIRKGPSLTGIDPERGELVPLFHPRWEHWSDHFVLRGPRIEGITPVGRATVQVLELNDARRLLLRAELVARGGLSHTAATAPDR